MTAADLVANSMYLTAAERSVIQRNSIIGRKVIMRQSNLL